MSHAYCTAYFHHRDEEGGWGGWGWGGAVPDTEVERQTDRQTDRQTERLIQTEGPTDRYRHRG